MFATSVIAKLRDPRSFRAALRGYRLLPRPAEVPVAAAVVATEIAVPVLLLSGTTARVGLVLAAGTLATFAVAMLSVLRRGLVAECGCARRGATVRPAHIWRNAVLIGVALAGAATVSLADGPSEPAVVAVLAVAAGCLVASLVFLDDLLFLFAAPAGRRHL